MNVKEEKPVAIKVTPEQASDLAALSTFAAEQPVVPGSPEAAALEVPTQVQAMAGEIGALVSAFVGIAAPMFPSLPGIYTAATTAAASQAVAAVCVKHGWLDNGIMGQWGEEIAAAVVLLPLAYATASGVKGDMAKMSKEKPKVERLQGADFSVPVTGAEVQAGSKTVSFGGAVPVAVEA